MSRQPPVLASAPPLPALLWHARPIRFLLILIMGWVTMRTAIYAAAMRQEVDAVLPPPRWPVAALVVPDPHPVPPRAATHPRPAMQAGDWHAASAGSAPSPRPDLTNSGRAAAVAGSGPASSNRHFLRLAMLGNLVPAPHMMLSGAATDLSFGRAAPWLSAPPSAASLRAPGATATSAIDRWSLAAWSVLRGDGGGASAAAPGFGAPTLGGSQAGLRLSRSLGRGGRLSAFARLTMPLRLRSGTDAALGLSWRPARGVPVNLNIEQRFAVGKDARTAPAVYAAGGVSDLGLMRGFRLDAYGQAGVVGVRNAQGFADGALAIEHRLGTIGGAPLSAGAVVAGAVQPGAARIDIGPRLSLRLPAGAQNSRLSLDWRQRVAGDARPGSGLALTLAGDF